MNENGSGPDVDGGKNYLCISPLLIRPRSIGRFAVYLAQGRRFVLYTRQGETFQDSHRKKLMDMGIERVYVRMEEKSDYEFYLRENLGDILGDDDIAVEERSRIWYSSSMSQVKGIFTNKLPKPVNRKRYEKVRDLIKASVKFFSKPGALANVARLVSHGYEIYDHSLGVMVLNTFVLQTLEETDEKMLAQCGVGALLHDLGKARVSKAVLDKKPDNLSLEERDMLRSHPAAGVAMCADLPVSRQVLNCILFHHERINGTGYPSAMVGEEMPPYVKSLAVCDEYDNLTRTKPWRAAKKPFEALQVLKGRLDILDKDMIRRLVLVLANAELVKDSGA